MFCLINEVTFVNPNPKAQIAKNVLYNMDPQSISVNILKGSRGADKGSITGVDRHKDYCRDLLSLRHR